MFYLLTLVIWHKEGTRLPLGISHETVNPFLLFPEIVPAQKNAMCSQRFRSFILCLCTYTLAREHEFVRLHSISKNPLPMIPLSPCSILNGKWRLISCLLVISTSHKPRNVSSRIKYVIKWSGGPVGSLVTTVKSTFSQPYSSTARWALWYSCCGPGITPSPAISTILSTSVRQRDRRVRRVG